MGNKEKGAWHPCHKGRYYRKAGVLRLCDKKGQTVLPTAEGTELIKLMPDYLKSAQMTTEWENDLLRMEKGELSSSLFMQGIIGLIEKMLVGLA